MSQTEQLPTMQLRKPEEGIRKPGDGWTLQKDCGPVQGEPSLRLAAFLEERETYVRGLVMVERIHTLEDATGLGQYAAQRMLEQQDQIPAEWRRYNLLFTETEWRSPGDRACVPCLYWRDFVWRLRWDCLDRSFDRSGRVVVASK